MKLQSLSIFSLLLLLTACSVRENDLWLQKAEQFYADKQIDSTLTYLNRIIPEKLEGEDVYTYLNPAKRNVMVVKNEMRLLKQKRNVLQI